MKRRRNVPASEKLRSETYYHGVPPHLAEDALDSGAVLPRSESGAREHEEGTWLDPRRGKAYVTPDLRRAARYTGQLGRDKGQPGGPGLLVEIDGRNLHDVEPDEDDVGRAIHIAWSGLADSTSLDNFAGRAVKALWPRIPGTTRQDLHTHRRSRMAERLIELAKPHLTVRQTEMMQGDWGDAPVSVLAKVGKKVLPHLPDDVKLWILERGSSIAHEGGLPISGAVACPEGLDRRMYRDEHLEECEVVWDSDDYRKLKRRLMR